MHIKKANFLDDFGSNNFFEIFEKNLLTNCSLSAIISFVDAVREHAGIGRQARLRGVCFVRVGSSPTARTTN